MGDNEKKTETTIMGYMGGCQKAGSLLASWENIHLTSLHFCFDHVSAELLKLLDPPWEFLNKLS